LTRDTGLNHVRFPTLSAPQNPDCANPTPTPLPWIGLHCAPGPIAGDDGDAEGLGEESSTERLREVLEAAAALGRIALPTSLPFLAALLADPHPLPDSGGGAGVGGGGGGGGGGAAAGGGGGGAGFGAGGNSVLVRLQRLGRGAAEGPVEAAVTLEAYQVTPPTCISPLQLDA